MANIAKFDEIMALEFTAAQSKRCVPVSDNPARALRSAKADQARLFDALDALTLEEQRAYGEYRLTHTL